MGDWLLGTDVSDFQSVDAWDRMRGDGVAYAWVKQSQGSFQCQQAVNHRVEADRRGVKVGGYSWAVFNAPAQSSAETFVRLLQQGPHTLPPVLDVEDVYPNGSPTGSDPAQRSDWIGEFQDIVEAEMGQAPMLYTGAWYWQPYVQDRSPQARWPLWVAAYRGGTALPDHMPDPFGPWDRVAVWQYAGDVPYFGMPGTDLNVIHVDQLAALSGGGTTQPDQQGGLFMAGEVTSFSNDALVQMSTALNVGGAANSVVVALGDVLKQVGDHIDRNGMLEARAILDGVNQHTDVDIVKGVGATHDNLAQMQSELAKTMADAIQKYGTDLRATAKSAAAAA